MNKDKFKKKFVGIVKQKFWKHIHKKTLIPFRKRRVPRNRVEFLDKLSEDIVNKIYDPSPPRGYVVSHKQNRVVRFIPVFTPKDYCVYFFCVKSLEDEIAKNRVPGTYGGWRLGGTIRRLENREEIENSPENYYFPDSSYNRFAWKKAWTDYQRKAYKLHSKKNLNYFILFDIANFYDAIRLDRLEIITREVAGRKKSFEVSLLFYFLFCWNRAHLNYERQSIGIPQDEVGDCSRILANFYLQEYDSYIYNLAKKTNSEYLRFSDDQIIGSQNENTVKELMFGASKELAKIGLNINAHKAMILDRREFGLYWSFDIFKLLEDKNNIQNIKKAFNIFKKKKNDNIGFKSESILKRLLSCNLRRLGKKHLKEIIQYVLDRKFLIIVNDYYLERIYNFLDSRGKRRFIIMLNKLSEDVLFNQYHLRVLRFSKKNNISIRRFSKLKSNLKRIEKIE